MLYWDNVGTIVPHAYIRSPELHDQYTLELIRAGLVLQVLPDDAGSSLGRHFGRYLELLSGQEIDRRRRDFAVGNFTRVHSDKWLNYMGGLQEVKHLGLATPVHYEPSGDWISLKTPRQANSWRHWLSVSAKRQVRKGGEVAIGTLMRRGSLQLTLQKRSEHSWPDWNHRRRAFPMQTRST